MATYADSLRSGATSADAPIETLRARVRGRVITPEDADYDAARLGRIGGFDRRPAAIVRVADAADVSRVVVLARESGLELAVRSGGHSMAGHSGTEGGIVLDLSAMKSLDIDVAGRTAWAGTGLTAGEYTTAAAAHGLATGFGDTASVGIGGITLGGGVGYFARKHGLTIDDLLAAEIVTADGELHAIDAGSEPDLFWAIRGGGGNVGVATRFRFRLHEVGTIVGGMMILPATPGTIAGFAAEADAAPEELSTIAAVMKAPPMPFVPEAYHGKPILLAQMCHVGDIEAGERAVAPIRALDEPIVDMVGPKPYPAMYPPEDDRRPLMSGHTMFVDTIDDVAAGTILDFVEASTALMGAVQLRVLGGAMARVPADATAFVHRAAPIMVNVAAMYANPAQAAEQDQWVAALAGALPQGRSGAYIGFMGDEGEDGVHAAYPGATWDRLAGIKARYDPTNLFRRNQNIPPASASETVVP